MNILKKFMNQGNKQDLLTIPSGEFDLLRPKNSPKSSLECIYSNASLTVRDLGQYHYVLAVKKVNDDEDNANDDDTEDFSDEPSPILSVQSSKKEEEWIFEFNEELKFHRKWVGQGDVTFVWNNRSGDERVQFVVASDVPPHDVDSFMDLLCSCYYETKFQKSVSHASSTQMKNIEAMFVRNVGEEESEQKKYGLKMEGESSQDIGLADRLAERMRDLDVGDTDNTSSEEEFQDVATDVADIKAASPALRLKIDRGKTSKESKVKTAPDGTELISETVELYLYDPIREAFIRQDTEVKTRLIEIGRYQYWLSVEGGKINLGTEINTDINPTFEARPLQFIFNYSFKSVVLSYMLKFLDIASFKRFRSVWSKCFWMCLNREPWEKLPQDERDYIIDPSTTLFKQLKEIISLDDEGGKSPKNDRKDLFVPEVSSSEEEEEEEEDESEGEEDQVQYIKSTQSFDKNDASRQTTIGKERYNKSLTVAYKNDRSYVIRDDKVGVFKTTDDLEFVTAIKNVRSLKGEKIGLANPMLYMEDTSLILSDGQNKNKLYRMDLNRGAIVEEWGTGERAIAQYGPTKKFDQLTSEQTILGVSQKSIFKLDPRINSDNKVVLDSAKDYVTKYNFSSLATTEAGNIAVGSEKGDIKLYDRLGIRAKTAIPSLGQPIRYLCASADGRWLLATCDSLLLLMDTTIKTGKNAGNLGFLKSFPAAENVKTYILRVSPQHATYMLNFTKKPIKFTRAYFNAGVNKQEDSILTSTGPFAVTWSLKKILKNDPNPYIVHRFESDIVEDNFKFGTNQRVVVALKNDVSLSKIRSFKKPSKDVLLPRDTLKEFYE